MTLRVGIIAQNIRQVRPRGVARVARALIEQLQHESDLDCYVISNPIYDLNIMVVACFGLQDYLAHVPLDLTSYAPRHATLKKWLGAGIVGFIEMLTRHRGQAATNLQAYESRCESRGFQVLADFDVVLSFEAFEELWDWPIELIETKFVGYCHDMIPFRIYEGPNAQPEHFYRTIAKFVLRADAIICNSVSTERDTHAFYPSSRSKTTVIPLGHDLNELPLVDRGGRSESEVRILMLGDMDRRKNPQGALRALQLIAERLPDRRVILEIMGGASQRNDFKVLEQDARRFAEVRWLGYLPDTARYEQIAKADVFLFPSLWEGFGIPILEAMDCGVPVVCSSLSSMPEVGGSHVHYIADPYDPQSIANAVLSTIELAPAEREAIVLHARAWARQFTWKRSATALAGSLREIVQKRKLPLQATSRNEP